jgi:hypothetical protein
MKKNLPALPGVSLVWISLFFLAACGPNPVPVVNTSEIKIERADPLKKLEWLEGNWKNLSGEGAFYESWKRANDSVIEGKSYAIKNQDTVFFEQLSLQRKGSDVFYVPVIKNQNEGKPVYFKLVNDSSGKFVFENKEHDFPQRIIYRQLKPDSVYACVEGMQNGEFRKEEFYLGREK